MSDEEARPAIEPLKGINTAFGPWPDREKINELVEAVNNLTRAVEWMAHWLVQAQTGFNAKDAERVVRIVRGEAKA